jgi:hypothetical protein
MPTFTFSRKSNYWRPQCRNKLRGETSNPRSYAIPCEVCVYPTDMPPVRNCWCTPELRPQGMSSSMTLTLPSALGADTATSAFTSQTQVFTYTNAGITGVPDATMIPADGVKTTTVTYTRERDYTSATGTSFIVKHLPTYLPAVPNINEDHRCSWIGLAGARYIERAFHSDILGSNASKSWTYQLGGVTKNCTFNDYEILKPRTLNTRTIVLDNNDPASIMAFVPPWRSGWSLNYYDWLRTYVPQISAGMPADMGRPCRPTACNISCYPVDPYCYTHRYNEILTRSGIPARQFSWWNYWTTMSGYCWVIKKVPSDSSPTSPDTNCWMAQLIYVRGGKFTSAIGRDPLGRDTYDLGSFVSSTTTNPRANVSRTGYPWAGVFQAYHTTGTLGRLASGSSGSKEAWFYPKTYHDNTPPVSGYSAVDRYEIELIAGLPADIPSMIGTARHPDWPATVPSVVCYDTPDVIPYHSAVVAIYATAPLPCNFTGTASMLRIADYRTAPNRPPGAINAGPSSFPATATLTF